MNLRERFNQYINFEGPIIVPSLGRCYIWTGALDKDLYGRFRAIELGLGSSAPAFKVAWILDNGPIPKGYVPDHLCTHPPCVRLSHLELVTSTENGRRGASKLTIEQVREIRQKLGTQTKASIAREYSVSYMTITFIERGKTWKGSV